MMSAGGTGTEADPYIIETPEQMAYLVSIGNNMAIPVGLLFMKGDSAKEYMPDLDYSNIWMTVENGTPVLRCFKNAEKYSCTREPAKVEIAFVTGEGSACEPIYGLPGYDKITEDMIPTPTRYGYDFGGWYYFDELDIPFDLEVFPEYDTYLYAKWIQRGFDQGFEGTIDETYDFGEGAQLFKPGVQGYNPRFVHGGLRSARTLGNGTQGIFLFSYDNMLTVGNKYEITFWMNTATEGASGKLEGFNPDAVDRLQWAGYSGQVTVGGRGDYSRRTARMRVFAMCFCAAKQY